MAYNTVILKNYVNNFGEGVANAAIKPGMLIEVMSTGNYRAHAGSAQTCLPIVALENKLEGKGLADAYAAADKVQYWIPQRGDEAYLQLADEQNIAIGDFLVSNGAGYVTKLVRTVDSWESADSQAAKSLYTDKIIGQALEALDLSSLSAAGSSDTPVRAFIRVRIM